MTKAFDPNAAATDESGIFGLPHTPAEAALVFLPVPWEATTSYGGGTSLGPAAILQASRQVDLYDIDVLRPYEPGLAMLEESTGIRTWNEEAKHNARPVIDAGGDVSGDPALQAALNRVNELSGLVNEHVRLETKRLLEAGKIVGLIGGDHSVPFGALQAVASQCAEFGVLHFDAHSDTRDAYEGFEFSHASIMHNVLNYIPEVTKLVQVGIRDFCEQEVDFCRAQGDRVKIFYDAHLTRRQFEGETWASLAKDIVSTLPQQVWVSFDIDALDPRFCPHTGTPVPGGLDFHQANFVLRELVRSGRTIIGFDLNEVAPAPGFPDVVEDEWDANVGARLLYKLSAWTLASRGLVKVAE